MESATDALHHTRERPRAKPDDTDSPGAGRSQPGADGHATGTDTRNAATTVMAL